MIESFLGFITWLLGTNDNNSKAKTIAGENTPLNIDNRILSFGPQTLDEFIGNSEVVERLKLAIHAAQIENRILPHVLFYGSPGLGKTTLAKLAAESVGQSLVEITGSTLRSQLDLVKVLKEVHDKNAILFIDEGHDLTKSQDLPVTVWLPLLQDFVFFHNLRGKSFKYQGSSYEIINNKIRMKPFTVIVATTDPADLIDAFRERFSVTCVLYKYTIEDMKKIIELQSGYRNFNVDKIAISTLAGFVRFNPRIAIHYLLGCHDRAVVENKGIINKNIVLKQMDSQSIKDGGLTRDDISILLALSQHPKGMGIQNLSGTVGIRQRTILEMIEPFLKQLGFIEVTHRRFISEHGIEYLKSIGEAE